MSGGSLMILFMYVLLLRGTGCSDNNRHQQNQHHKKKTTEHRTNQHQKKTTTKSTNNLHLPTTDQNNSLQYQQMSTQIIISLAHLLHQNSPDYESAKNSLLDTTAALSLRTARSASQVHAVLTGSPRPTFAETNAWLLEHTPRKRCNTEESCGSIHSETSDLQEYVKESQWANPNSNINDLCGSPTKIGGSVLSHYRSRKNMEGDVCGGGGEKGNVSNVNAMGPLVGQAVVNSIATKKGVGLQSSRAKLLQGTIDRPLWDQRRWTDGECLFSDLVDRCGLESFANTKSHEEKTMAEDVADCAAGKITGDSNTTGLDKTSNLSAHLITVPTQVLTTSSGSVPGMDDETVNEIARGVIRFLMRKQSPAVSTIYLVMSEEEMEKQSVISEQLMRAWVKLEQYNDLIGQPKLLAGASFEFVYA
jgi:hypothetical protein